jgi:ribosomal protein S18 acetylase RimI-like enzyme
MITVRPLTPADFALGMELKAAAGWNQTEADWRRAYELEPNGGYIGLCDGTPAATLTTAVFGRTAWIAMVLTAAEFRGRGLATALLKQSLADLEARGVDSVRLDATALGRPVYEKLGFTVDSEVTRYFGRPIVSPNASSDPDEVQITPFEARHLDQAAEIDRAASGNDRRRLLEIVHRDWPAACLVAERKQEVVGFGMARRGSRATQVGPIIVADHAIGITLLTTAFAQLGASGIYLDVPHGNRAAREIAASSGLASERDFFRMTRGKQVIEQSQCIWANYGPEKG